MRAIRIAVLLAAIGAACSAFPQTRDFSLSILQGGLPRTEGDVVFALVVHADYWTLEKEPFVVRLNVPPELEPASFCGDESSFDPATRVLTWAGRLDNEVISERSCPLTFRVAPAVAPGSTFSLTATLTTSTPDPNPANNAAALSSVVIASADLAVESSADVQRLKSGAPLTYTFTITNRGPQDAHEVTLSDYLSPYVTFISFQQVSGPPASLDTFARETGLCSGLRCGRYVEARMAVLPNGSSATFRLFVTADSSFESADIGNRAIIKSVLVDPFERNNELDVWAFAGPNADLALTSRRAPDESFAIDIANDGPESVNNVTVSHALQPTAGQYDFVDSVRFLTVTPSQGTCSAAVFTQMVGSPEPPPFWTLECALGTLAPGGRATITVVIERRQQDSFKLSSAVSPSQNDPDPVNNQSSETVSSRRRPARK